MALASEECRRTAPKNAQWSSPFDPEPIRCTTPMTKRKGPDRSHSAEAHDGVLGRRATNRSRLSLSASLAEQVWQLGDVAGDAACLSEIFLVRQGTGESVMTFWLVASA
jgi:hypothetical protein